MMMMTMMMMMVLMMIIGLSGYPTTPIGCFQRANLTSGSPSVAPIDIRLTNTQRQIHNDKYTEANTQRQKNILEIATKVNCHQGTFSRLTSLLSLSLEQNPLKALSPALLTPSLRVIYHNTIS